MNAIRILGVLILALCLAAPASFAQEVTLVGKATPEQVAETVGAAETDLADAPQDAAGDSASDPDEEASPTQPDEPPAVRELPAEDGAPSVGEEGEPPPPEEPPAEPEPPEEEPPPPSPPPDDGGGNPEVKGLSWPEVLVFAPGLIEYDAEMKARIEATGRLKLRYLRRHVQFIAKFNPDPAIRAKAKQIAEDIKAILGA